ncbi:MAG: hypothetical protein J2P25_03370 [Nocardiopsaceae bacterium]|nr:hypothetical protein [Nocardiopsaceae bacterium]
MLAGGAGGAGQPYRIRITPESLYECAKKCLRGADDVAVTRERLARALGGITSGMAGNDQAGKQWAASFDRALQSLFRALTAAVTSVDGMGQGLTQAANNVLAADHRSAVDQSHGDPFSYPMPCGPYVWQADPGIPSAAGSGSPPWPPPLDKIPNGHQDRLRQAASDLRSAACSLQDAGSGLESAITQVTDLNSSASVEAMTGYFRRIWSPAAGPLYVAYEACLKLAQACEGYAAQIDQAHHAVEMAIPHALKGWKGWLAGAVAIGGIALTFFTGSGSDEAAADIDTSLLASEIAPALAALNDALDGIIATLDAIIATLESAADAAPTMDIVEADTAEDADLATEGAEESEGVSTGDEAFQAERDAASAAGDDPEDIFVKDKHLPSSGGRYAKFATSDKSEAQSWIAEALKSKDAVISENNVEGTFKVETDLGRAVGTKGQTAIRAIVTYDGRVINAFPVNAGGG